jgi:hypothetical protein
MAVPLTVKACPLGVALVPAIFQGFIATIIAAAGGPPVKHTATSKRSLGPIVAPLTALTLNPKLADSA